MGLVTDYLKCSYANKVTLAGNFLFIASSAVIGADLADLITIKEEYLAGAGGVAFSGLLLNGFTLCGFHTLASYRITKNIISRGGDSKLQRLVNIESGLYCNKKGVELALKESGLPVLPHQSQFKQ